MGKVAWRRGAAEAAEPLGRGRAGRSRGPPTAGGGRKRRRRSPRRGCSEAEDERVPHGSREDTAKERGGIQRSWSGGVQPGVVGGRTGRGDRLQGWVQRTADEGQAPAAEAVAQIEAGQREQHLAEVAGRLRWGSPLRGRLGGAGRPAGEQGPRGGELGVDVAGGEQAMMADLDEALGQHVQHEPPEKLVGGERDGGRTAGAEGDAALVEGDEAMVADADPVGVLAEVAEDQRVVAERRLAVHDPAEAAELVEETPEGVAVGEGRGGPVEAELSLPMRSLQGVEELATEQLSERGRERGSAPGRRPTAGHRGTARLR